MKNLYIILLSLFSIMPVFLWGQQHFSQKLTFGDFKSWMQSQSPMGYSFLMAEKEGELDPEAMSHGDTPDLEYMADFRASSMRETFGITVEAYESLSSLGGEALGIKRLKIKGFNAAYMSRDMMGHSLAIMVIQFPDLPANVTITTSPGKSAKEIEKVLKKMKFFKKMKRFAKNDPTPLSPAQSVANADNEAEESGEEEPRHMMNSVFSALGGLLGGNASAAEEKAPTSRLAAKKSSMTQAANTDPIERYPFKTGMIKYKISGNENGSETVYWKDKGNLESRKRISEIKVLFITQKSVDWTISKGSMIYSIDESDRTIHAQDVGSMARMAGSDQESRMNFGKDFLNNNGRKIGSEKILGKSCEIWEISSLSSKVWIWKGLPLKSEVNLGGRIVSEAVEIKVNQKVDDSYFELPEGYQQM